MNSKKKFLSLLLCLAVIFGSLPFTAVTSSAEVNADVGINTQADVGLNEVVQIATFGDLKAFLENDTATNAVLTKTVTATDGDVTEYTKDRSTYTNTAYVFDGCTKKLDLNGFDIDFARHNSIYVPSMAKLTVTNSNYLKSNIENGTGVKFESSFDTSICGGAFYNSGMLSIYGVNIKDCKANDYGGGIYSNEEESCTTWLTNVDITNCTANQGGGIFADGGGNITTLTDVKVKECTATNCAGVFNYGKMMLASNTQIIANKTGNATNSNLTVFDMSGVYTPITLAQDFSGSAGVSVVTGADETGTFFYGTGIFATGTDTTPDVSGFIKSFKADEPDKYHVVVSNTNCLALADGATTYYITKTPPTNGDFTISTTTNISSGTNITIQPTPKSGYKTDTVTYSYDGNTYKATEEANGTYTFKMPSSDVTVAVTFKQTGGGSEDPAPTKYVITATATDGGTITPSGDVKVIKGKNQSFTASPTDGYSLEKFIVDGEDVTVDGNTYTFENVTAKHTIQAVFIENKPEPIPDGWLQTDGNWRYYKDNGFLTGWHSDIPGWEGQWFYFDRQTGVMQSGKVFIDDGYGDFTNKLWYYLDPTTGVMQMNWKQIDNNWYYLRPNWGGAMSTSWQQLNWSGGTDWFYFDVESCAMQIGMQNNIPGWEGRYFCFDKSTGAMKTGRVEFEGSYFETDANGCIIGNYGNPTKGIDVSQWQGSYIDWQQVKNDGVEFVMIRSNYGWTGKDIYFDQNIQGAKAAGLHVGVYLYSYATTVDEAVLEFNNLMSTISGYDIDFPIAYDLEDACQTGLSVQELSDIAVTFCNMVRNAGYEPMVYASTSWMTNRLDYNAISQYKLWVAQYNTTCDYAYRNPPNMWQYTSQGSVNGIEGNVDMNRLYY